MDIVSLSLKFRHYEAEVSRQVHEKSSGSQLKRRITRK